VTSVRLSQGNTGHLTFLKKLGISHTKTIENGFDMESSIIYVSFYEKNSQKPLQTIFKITEVYNQTGVTPYYNM
jgi:hypothetical protein